MADEDTLRSNPPASVLTDGSKVDPKSQLTEASKLSQHTDLKSVVSSKPTTPVNEENEEGTPSKSDKKGGKSKKKGKSTRTKPSQPNSDTNLKRQKLDTDAIQVLKQHASHVNRYIILGSILWVVYFLIALSPGVFAVLVYKADILNVFNDDSAGTRGTDAPTSLAPPEAI